MLVVTLRWCPPASTVVCGADGVEQVGGDLFGLFACGVREHHRELVAAEPPDHVGGTQPTAHHEASEMISSSPAGVTEGVVDLFEVVEVQHQQGARLP